MIYNFTDSLPALLKAYHYQVILNLDTGPKISHALLEYRVELYFFIQNKSREFCETTTRKVSREGGEVVSLTRRPRLYPQ
jgi:hypothetical protein